MASKVCSECGSIGIWINSFALLRLGYFASERGSPFDVRLVAAEVKFAARIEPCPIRRERADTAVRAARSDEQRVESEHPLPLRLDLGLGRTVDSLFVGRQSLVERRAQWTEFQLTLADQIEARLVVAA